MLKSAIHPLTHSTMNSSDTGTPREIFSRAQSGYSRSPITQQYSDNDQFKHEQLVKNMYKRQLDELMRQKNEIKSMEKEREVKERK